MAYFDAGLSSQPNLVQALLRCIWETPFDRRARKLAADVAAFRAMSDAELAAKGIRRDEILMHVFARSSI